MAHSEFHLEDSGEFVLARRDDNFERTSSEFTYDPCEGFESSSGANRIPTGMRKQEFGDDSGGYG